MGREKGGRDQQVLVKPGIRHRNLRFQKGRRMGAEEERKWEWRGGDIVNQWAVTLVIKPPACPPERAGPCKESRLCDSMEAERFQTSHLPFQD